MSTDVLPTGLGPGRAAIPVPACPLGASGACLVVSLCVPNQCIRTWKDQACVTVVEPPREVGGRPFRPPHLDDLGFAISLPDPVSPDDEQISNLCVHGTHPFTVIRQCGPCRAVSSPPVTFTRADGHCTDGPDGTVEVVLLRAAGSVLGGDRDDRWFAVLDGERR